MRTNPITRRLRRRRELQRRKSALGVAARARIRAERNAEAGQWQTCGLLLVHMTASPDGRSMGIRVVGQDDWHRIGSFRHCSALLRTILLAAIARRSRMPKDRLEGIHTRKSASNAPQVSAKGGSKAFSKESHRHEA